MSGLFPDIASWALGGGAGQGGDNDEQDEENGQQLNDEELTEEEVRARRLARMEALQKQQQEAAAQQQEAQGKDQDPTPMEVDDSQPSPAAKKDKMEVENDNGKQSPKSAAPSASQPTEQKKQKTKESNNSPADAARKQQKKAESLLKKVLSIALAGTSTTSDSSCVVVDIDNTSITEQTIAEILATRLSLSPDAPELRTMPAQKPLIPYLAQCHRRAAEESKTLKSAKKEQNQELIDILEEIKRQVVSYAASCIIEPELFEMGKDATTELANCFTSTVTDPASSITFGVNGTTSSFYYCLCEELVASDKDTFGKVIGEIVNHLTKKLTNVESVLDGGGDVEGGAIVMVSAITSVCIHKEAAKVLTQMDSFLLPPAESEEAKKMVDPPPVPQGADFMTRLMMQMRNHGYLKRSGPALDKETVLGACLKVGIPKNNNPAFNQTSILSQTVESVERTSSSQRQQLRVYQDACYQLIMQLIKAGPEARSKVIL